MKKLLSVILAVLMLGGCFALSAGARENSVTFRAGSSEYNFTYHAGGEEHVFPFPAYASGRHRISIQSEGVSDLSYQLVDITGLYGNYASGTAIASYDAFPASAEYELTGERTYAILFSFSSESIADAVLRLFVEGPGGSTTYYTYDPDLGCNGIFPSAQANAGKYKLTITHSGKFEFISYKVSKTSDEKNFEVLAVYENAFPVRAEYTLAAGEYLYFEYQISRNTKDAVSLQFALQEPETGFWVSWPSWAQWILKYLLFGWLWMTWF